AARPLDCGLNRVGRRPGARPPPERWRTADRAGGVEAQAPRNDGGGGGGAASAAAAARNASRIVWVVNRPERLAVRGDLVHEAINNRHVRERSHAERNPASRDQTLNHDRMTLRDVSLERAIPARRGG